MITLDEVHKMLERGITTNGIQSAFFDSVESDIITLKCSKERMNEAQFKRMLDTEFGINIDFLIWKEVPCTIYKCCDMKLKNATIRLTKYNTSFSSVTHRFFDIEFWPDLSIHSWRLEWFAPDTLVHVFNTVDERYPEILRAWKDYEKECLKFYKVRKFSEDAITQLVKDKLKGTNFEYNLTMNPTNILIKVKMKRARFFEITIPHKNYYEILSDSFIENIRKVSRLIDEFKCNCRIQGYGNNLRWFKSE